MIVRFGVIGLINTAISISAIMVGLWVGLHDYVANFLAYSAGLCFSYFANRRWTFKAAGKGTTKEASQFLLAFVAAYGVNFLLLAAARSAGFNENPLSHLLGMAGYTVTFFAFARLWVFSPPPTEHFPVRDILIKKYPEIALLTIALGAFLALRTIHLTHDVVWQFWIARQIIGGAKLYSDIWEINPPLWFWSAVPIQYAAMRANLPPSELYIAIITGMGFASALLTTRLMNISDPSRKLAIMGLSFWVMVLMPLYDFGQREQLALICALPYSALIARRHSGHAVATSFALAVGLFAAYGFALKHYFIIIPVALELWLAIKQGRKWQVLRPEILALGACATLYATSVVLFAPEFITRMVPMVNTAYHGYITPWSRQMESPIPKIWVAALFFFLLHRKMFSKSSEPIINAFAITASGFAFAYIVQRKGWLYHSIPVTAFLILSIVVYITRNGIGKTYKYPHGLIFVTFTLTLHIMIGSYENFYKIYSDRFLATLNRNSPVLVLSSEPMLYWPMGEDRQLKWVSPLYTYWMLPAIGSSEASGERNIELERLSSTIIERTAKDIKCYRPEIILIERKPFYAAQPPSFDVRKFFFKNIELRNFIEENYQQGKHSKILYVYYKIKNSAYHNTPLKCRKIK